MPEYVQMRRLWELCLSGALQILDLIWFDLIKYCPHCIIIFRLFGSTIVFELYIATYSVNNSLFRPRRRQDDVNRLSVVSNSTTRTPATDMLYNNTHRRAHNNSTTCCTTNSPAPTDKNLPHPNILTYRDVGLWHCDVVWQICCTGIQQVVESLWACSLVVWCHKQHVRSR